MLSKAIPWSVCGFSALSYNFLGLTFCAQRSSEEVYLWVFPWASLGNGPNSVSESTLSNTELSEDFWPSLSSGELSVLKRCVPKMLAFAFCLRLRSKTRCFKTRVLGRRLPNGKPQERLRFRALRRKTLAFKKRIAIVLCDLKTSLGARACV